MRPDPADESAAIDASCDLQRLIDRTFRRAALAVKRTGLSIGSIDFHSEVTAQSPDRFQIYAPLNSRLVVPNYADPTDGVEEYIDAMEQFLAAARRELRAVEVKAIADKIMGRVNRIIS
jgi:hypothetical protein